MSSRAAGWRASGPLPRQAGWRAEDHALNLAGVTNLVKDRETVNAEIPLSGLGWIISPRARVSAGSGKQNGRHGDGRACRLGDRCATVQTWGRLIGC